MNGSMKKRSLVIGIVGIVVSLAVGVGAYGIFFYQNSPPPRGGTQEDVSQGFEGFVRSRAEDTMRKNYNASLIATYEKMRLQFPDSLDLKKKLATAYVDTRQYDKAKPLLEEVLRSSPEDPQAKKLLQEIPK